MQPKSNTTILHEIWLQIENKGGKSHYRIGQLFESGIVLKLNTFRPSVFINESGERAEIVILFPLTVLLQLSDARQGYTVITALCVFHTWLKTNKLE